MSWVKGHQDQYLDHKDLTPAAKGNIHANDVCTAIHSLNVSDVGLSRVGSREHWQHSSTMADSYPNASTLMSALPQLHQEPKPTSLTSLTDATVTSKSSGLGDI